ncbi:MAG TPA: OmpA family protein [Sphingomonas sp.]|nr:OmpA family protein [Sphingomonas sp.]
MDNRRIAALGAGAAVTMAALMLAGCGRGGAPANQAAASNGAGAKTVFGAPAPSPSPTPSPTATPSPRSIMQPSVNPQPIEPPPLMPFDATVGFPDGGSKLDDAAKQQLDTILANPVTASGGPVVLRGSSDSHGSDADNRAMSKKRAEAVAHYLEGRGIAKERITVIALGEDRPVAPNANLDGSDNPEGRAKNRRVDVSVSPGVQPNAAPAPAPSPSAPPGPLPAASG